MNIELSNEDVEFLTLLLDRELSNTLIEHHHTRDRNYKEIVKNREAEIERLLGKLKNQ